MSDYSGLKRAATYLPPDLYQALRVQAFENERTLSSELKALVERSVKQGSTESTTERYILQYALSKVAENPGLKWEQYAVGFDGLIRREMLSLGWTEGTVLHRLKDDGKIATDEGDVVVLSDSYEEN